MKKLALIVFTVGLLGSTAYVLLSTFVLEQRLQTSVAVATPNATDSARIEVSTHTAHDTKIYVADIKLQPGQVVQTALADNTYGKNVSNTTSDIAGAAGAEIAVNGDFYGARTNGYVIRNGELLRKLKVSDDQEDVVLWRDGTMTIISEGNYTAQELLDKGAMQVMSFGPGLVIDGKTEVSATEEVGISMESNPRTAIGYVDKGHYLLVVADGRTDVSEGLSLYELAEFMKNKFNVTQAYNLDGGGSSTMYHKGQVINRPTTNGTDFSEREVSDIVYVK
ncbi:MAG: phosphodiester glycosidase family protein [bacterium]|nr:phosphodiester glycosidase family protein [bacterium]